MIEHYQIGMYVRCPVELEHKEYPRRFAIGQISDIDSAANVDIHEAYSIPRRQKFDVDDMQRCTIMPQSSAKIRSSKEIGRILRVANQGNDHQLTTYFVESVGNSNVQQIQIVAESELEVSFMKADVDPVEMMKQYELHLPLWYFHRQIVADSLHTLRNATLGFETLIGSRVFLLEHQIDAIVRGISDNSCRFMLADEVGLGKTVEAIVILKGLQKRWGKLCVLLILPKSLIYQWKNEIFLKFTTKCTIFEPGVELEDETICLFPLEEVETDWGACLLARDWDVCVVDETHRLLHMPIAYQRILEFSKKVTHVLLLTATPIQSRQTEFLRLVSLLEPNKYQQMSEQAFEDMLDKQSFLRRKVHHLMLDLEDYLADDDLVDEFKDGLTEIAEKLQDKTLQDIVKEIAPVAADKGLEKVRLSLAYISEHYQIERRIIRHRRKELKDQLAKRTFQSQSYQMQGSDTNYYEFETYAQLLEYLSSIGEKGSDTKAFGSLSILFLSAMFSSPWALLELIHARKAYLSGKQTDKYPSVSVGDKSTEEVEPLEKLRSLVVSWLRATEQEFRRWKEFEDEPDLEKGRLMHVVDHILQMGANEKIVVFTNWLPTLRALEDALEQAGKKKAVRSFCKGKNESELQAAIDDFQSDGECRILLCDELGGEGRNLQMATRLVHVDLPWSPSQLEQRIGRLDRIGRKEDVCSVVVYAEETVEEHLLAIWQDGLGIFEESLSGLEIAIEEIQRQMIDALQEDIRYGLEKLLPTMQDTLSTMKKSVDEERFFDMARQLDARVAEQLKKLIDKFDENNGQILTTTMMKWANLAGFRGHPHSNSGIIRFRQDGASLKSMKITLFMIPDMAEGRRRMKSSGDVSGTFQRGLAVGREDLVFFAPGESFFEAIVQNAYESNRGRCCAVELKAAPLDWTGFVFTWSVTVDAIPLLQLGESEANLALVQGYAPLSYLTTLEGLESEDQEKDQNVIRQFLQQERDKSEYGHLGERGNGSIRRFQAEFPLDDWEALVDYHYATSREKAYSTFYSQIQHAQAERDLQKRLDAMKASLLYYGNLGDTEKAQLERLARINEALLKGVTHPSIRLESVAFVRMVKKS